MQDEETRELARALSEYEQMLVNAVVEYLSSTSGFSENNLVAEAESHIASSRHQSCTG